MDLPLLDGIVVAVLLAGLIVMGYWGKRFMKSVSQFTIAGRHMGQWLGLSTGVAEGIGLISIANSCQLGFRSGFSYIWMGLAGMLLIGLPLFGMIGLGIKRYRATKVQTLPQYYEMRFSRGVRLFSGFTLAFGGVLNMAIFPIVGSQFLMAFLGIENTVVLNLGFYQFTHFHLILLGVLALSVFFSMIGGMVSVILTDYIQSVLLFLSITVISILILKTVGLSNLKNAAQSLGDGAFNPFAAKSIGPRFIIIWLAGSIIHRLAFPPALQKMAAAKSPEVVRRMYLLSSLFAGGRGMILVVWGLAALALLGPEIPAGVENKEIYHRTVGAIMLRQITGNILLLKGVALAGFIFAFISTIDSYLLSWGAVIANDCVCALRKNPVPKDKHIAILRWSLVGIGVFIFLFGCWYDPKQTILQFFYTTGAIFGACGLLTWLGLYWKRATTAGAWACLITGLIIPISWFLFEKYCLLPGHTWPKWMDSDNFTLAATFVPVVAMVVVSLLTKAPEHFIDYGKRLKELAEEDEAVYRQTYGERRIRFDERYLHRPIVIIPLVIIVLLLNLGLVSTWGVLGWFTAAGIALISSVAIGGLCYWQGRSLTRYVLIALPLTFVICLIIKLIGPKNFTYWWVGVNTIVATGFSAICILFGARDLTALLKELKNATVDDTDDGRVREEEHQDL